ncbi:MAG: hypothetical protein ACREBR_03735, partial [bacterium]
IIRKWLFHLDKSMHQQDPHPPTKTEDWIVMHRSTREHRFVTCTAFSLIEHDTEQLGPFLISTHACQVIGETHAKPRFPLSMTQ